MNNFNSLNLNVLLLLSFAHGITDLSQGAIPVLLPFFQNAFQLTYTQIGLIVLVSNLTACLSQPVFGYVSDKTTAKWLMPIGCLLSALGVGLTGLSWSFALLLIMVAFSGIGVAAFHPEASKFTHFASGEKKASGMSVFSVGGNLGYAFGSIIITGLLIHWGLSSTIYLAIPGLLVAIILWTRLGRIASNSNSLEENSSLGKKESFSWQKIAPALSILLFFIVLRSWIQSGLATYIPLYYTNYLHNNPLLGSYLLSAFLLAGGIGTLLGGPISDKFGRRNLMIGSLLLSFVLMVIFPHTTGWVTTVVLVFLGGILASSYSTTVVLGQQMMPENVGIASGIILGFSFGLGGIGVLFLGNIADYFGVPMVFLVLNGFAILTLVLGFFVREEWTDAALG